MKAKDVKCCVCGKQAVAYYPCFTPDIPSYPYCADHLEKTMIDMAKAVWKDNIDMQDLVIQHAKETVKRYKERKEK